MMALDQEALVIQRPLSESKFEESKEFLVLRPFCNSIVQNPCDQNFKQFQTALSIISDPPQHLAQYVVFPFVMHLKIISKYKENIRIGLFDCIGQVLNKFELHSWEMFIEIFQRLHMAIGSNDDPTKVNSKISEDEVDSLVSSISSLVKKSLFCQFDVLFGEKKIPIVAHSVFLMLQIAKMDIHKRIRMKALEILDAFATHCQEKDDASKRFFKFLPGIVSNLRPLVNLKSGRNYQDIVLKGIEVLWKVVAVSVNPMDRESLDQPDQMLAYMFLELSEELVLHDNVLYRKSIFDMSTELLKIMNGKMMRCRDILLNNLLLLSSDKDGGTSLQVTKVLQEYPDDIESIVSYESVIEVTRQTMSQLNDGLEKSVIISLKKLACYLSVIKFNYLELREYLPLLFSLVNDMILKFSSITHCEMLLKLNANLQVCQRICIGVMHTGYLGDVLEEINSYLCDFKGQLQNSYPKLSEFEVSQFCNNYISIIDMQSTEIILSILESEAPKVQNVIDLRKAYLLEGLSLMAKIYPEYNLSVVLYILIEYAGLEDSELLSQTAKRSLNRLSEPNSLPEFLKFHLSLVMNELSVRILNLSLHPNCPNALIFLAQYFDFTQSTFVNLIDEVFSRSCDPLCGDFMQPIYVKVFFAFLTSLMKEKTKQPDPDTNNLPNTFLSHKYRQNSTLLQRMLEYQKSIGINTSTRNEHQEALKKDDESGDDDPSNKINEVEEPLSSELNLTVKICHRVLNFLPNSERYVRLMGMDCLIKGFFLLQYQEDVLLPLAHTVWQNVVPRFSERDYVVVRKSFDLLVMLCNTCGTFLKKRILDEAFPKLSSLLLNLALESELVKYKDRKYYTYTQAFKLQLTILKGMSSLCEAIDIQEEELDTILTGCRMYLNPGQHKSLKDAAKKLIDALASGTHSRSIWIKLILCGMRNVPQCPHAFTPVPVRLLGPRNLP